MRLETLALLEDIREAGEVLAGFVEGKCIADYLENLLLAPG